MIVKESDNNVKLIVLDRLIAMKDSPAHERILQELVMDVLRVLASPDLEVRRKTLGLAMDLSQQLNAPVPMGSQARALYAMHKAKGNGPLDFSSVLSLYADAD